MVGDSTAVVKQHCGLPLATVNRSRDRLEFTYGDHDRRRWLIVVVREGRVERVMRGIATNE